MVSRWVLVTAAAVLASGCESVYPASCGIPGMVAPCACPGEMQGTHVCGLDGVWNDGKQPSSPVCNCDAPVPITARELGGTGLPPIGLGAGTGGGVSGDGNGGGGVSGTGGVSGAGGVSGTGGISGTGGTTATPQPWGDCMVDRDCPEGDVCERAGTGTNGYYCSAPCTPGGFVSGCPPAPDGGGAVSCSARGRCVMACAPGGACPAGMQCAVVGFSRRCVW